MAPFTAFFENTPAFFFKHADSGHEVVFKGVYTVFAEVAGADKS